MILDVPGWVEEKSGRIRPEEITRQRTPGRSAALEDSRTRHAPRAAPIVARGCDPRSRPCSPNRPPASRSLRR